MRPVVAIDVALLAIPSVASSAAAVEGTLANVNEWAAAMEKENCCQFAICSEAVAVLQAANCFPATHNVQALLELYQLGHVFSARDVNSRIFSIISRAERLVDVYDLEVLETETTIAAAIDFSDGPDALVQSAQATLATVAWSKFPEMSRVALGFSTSQSKIRFESWVTNAEIVAGELQTYTPAKQAASEIICVSSPSEFLGTLNPATLWFHADDEIQYHLAISLKIALASGTPLESLPSEKHPDFVIGPNFTVSLAKNQADKNNSHADVVRKKCAQAIVGQLELDTGRSEETRKFDGAKSVRIHVTKHHEAIRLMLWRCPGGHFEIANIGPKSELTIQVGVSGGAQRARFRFH
jgi:hypothetical protein